MYAAVIVKILQATAQVHQIADFNLYLWWHLLMGEAMRILKTTKGR